MTSTRFQLNTVQLFLTYPKCNTTPESVLDQLERQLCIKEYIIAQEDHKDGSKHLHAYIKLNKRKKCYGDMLDITDENGDTHHGNYQRCRNGYLVQKYCKKGGEFITNMEFNLLAQAVDLARSGDVKAAFDAVAEARPDMVLTAGTRIKTNLQMLADDGKQEDDNKFTNFINIPAKMLQWQRTQHSLWLIGPSGVGKTEYAKSLFNNALLVSHVDQLKKLGAEHDGIIFDDFSICHWPREAGIHITDLANKRGINVKHGVVVIPKGMPRVFCSNEWIWPEDDSGAIKRRVHCVRVQDKLYHEDPADKQDKPADDWDMVGQSRLVCVNDRLMARG